MLSQKGLATTEAVGALARNILPFENAHSTTHRLATSKGIMEECVNTILCAMSIGYSLGATDDDFVAMLLKKAEQWDSLQMREAIVEYPLPFELHITVSEVADAEKFKTDCKNLEVKPIFLALQDLQGKAVLNDVMTSSVFLGDNRGTFCEMERIASGLSSLGYQVVRTKIETVPWHPAAPSSINGVNLMPIGCYFESHLGVMVETTSAESEALTRKTLSSLALQHRAHLSKNLFKQIDENVFTVMITLRSYENTRERFESSILDLKAALLAAYFKVEKVITEFSLFDSKTNHDAMWLAAT